MIKTIKALGLALVVGVASSAAIAAKSIPLSYLNVDGIHVDASGLIYAASGFSGTKVYVITPDGNTFDFADGLNGPIDITNDSQGNLYVTNFNDATVSKITPDQVVSKFADVLPGPAGIVADANDNLYVSHYGEGNGDGTKVLKITPDGDVSVFSEDGLLLAPVGTAIDEDGNLYTANFNDGRVIKISPDGGQELIAQIESEVGFAIGHLAYVRGRLFATGPAGQTVYVVRMNGKVRERNRKVDAGAFPNGIASDPLTDSVLFTYAFAAVSKIEKIHFKH